MVGLFRGADKDRDVALTKPELETLLSRPHGAPFWGQLGRPRGGERGGEFGSRLRRRRRPARRRKGDPRGVPKESVLSQTLAHAAVYLTGPCAFAEGRALPTRRFGVPMIRHE